MIEFTTEFYVTILQPKFYIPVASEQLVTGYLSKRGVGKHRTQRFCTICNYTVIGDEFHYLLECDYFRETRQML